MFGPDFEEEDTKGSSPAGQLARRLKKFLTDTHRLFRRVDFKQWTLAFDTLLKQHDQELVEQVLIWVLDNPEKAEVKKLRSAYNFCESFDRLRLHMDLETFSAEQLSPAGQQLLTKLGNLSLPKGLDSSLPVIVHYSLVNFGKFVTKVTHIRARNVKELQRLLGLSKHPNKDSYERPPDLSPEESKDYSRLCQLNNLIDYLGSVGLLSMTPGLYNWLAETLEAVAAWDAWSGSVQTLIFDHHQSRFEQAGKDCVYRWCGNSKRWDELMKELDHGTT